MARALEKPAETVEGRLCPIRDVARYLSLSRSKIYAMMDAGELPYVKLGKSRRVNWTDVLKLIADNTIGRAQS
ncbi:Helix-turn-helix domain protein [Anatilimnocola aggregata]|uniref:Helix-turn-helix domain protein n=1 Tax=Anatilimnocola aggregata TaxID=2528021 RepID=A0A517YE46_9BACT|nr:helix-turn-helix domain-containing protein [Anatilimnocola aggregata]QDU28508.1 Helix-turn-helix domain protein [Anatilimnocola aggregata]